MRTFEQALPDHELIVLRVIGEWWELNLTGDDKAACVAKLAKHLVELDLAQELLFLPPEEAVAVRYLVTNHGRVPVATFTRQHGEVRLMGPAALAREEPWYDPANAAEALWYRGFLFRGFDDTDDGPIEFYYLPTELQAQLSAQADASGSEADFYQGEPESDYTSADGDESLLQELLETNLLSRGLPTTNKKKDAPPAPSAPAPPPTPPTRVLRERSHYAALTAVEPPAQWVTAPVDAVDDMATMLAMAQMGQLHEGQGVRLQPYLYNGNLARLGLLTTMALEMGLLKQVGESYRPSRAALPWLKEGREKQLRALAEAWSKTAWNELRHLPELICEGSGWSNDPLAARTAVLDALTLTEEWFAMADLVAFIKKETPDFQRPHGNYDVWYIRDRATGAYVTGFENWDLVEGRLLPFLLLAPMQWLGLVETADKSETYRLTTRAVAWLHDTAVDENDLSIPLVVRPEGTLLVPFNANRYQRFQAARIGQPLPVEKGQPFEYRITPHSLQLAQEQKIASDRVLAFLEQASGRPLPASTKRGIERWAEKGTEGRLEQVVVLRVADESILETLRKHPKTRPFLGESLGDLAAVVQAEQWPELCAAAAQLGLLLDGVL